MPRKVGIAVILAVAFAASAARAASWRGIDPLNSRRADVMRILGKPASENAADSSMRFSTPEGVATVSFVTQDFGALKGWDPALVGTVVQILLQHENSKETAKSLGLEGNRKLDREERGELVFYRDRKEGIIRIFNKNGKLATTIYAPADGGPGKND
jgi:hypothetical protein